MIKVTEEEMYKSGICFVKVQIGDDLRVFFDGDYDCLYNHLDKLGMESKDILHHFNSFKKVKL